MAGRNVKVERAATPYLQEDAAMNKTKWSRGASDLTALVNEIIAYWKAIAERSFKETHPFSDSNEFEQSWPKTLDNFFLAEIDRTVKMLSSLPTEGGNN
jgi:muramoyltetrapeptide carboxypeptidase LdcA involved in peptidoglycan recycling